MRFALGSTRIVILTPRYAIKIARPRPLRPLLQLFRHLFNGEVSTRLQKFDKNPAKGGVKYLLAGFRANLVEMQIYRQCGSDILAPTICTIFGIVNIQLRGAVVQESDIAEHVLHTFFEAFPISESDIFQAKQFCNIEGVVVLADYGRHDLIPALCAYKDKKSPT